jgi:hypothetical protein
MRAVTITKEGGPEVLAVRDWPVRAAGHGEVRIDVKAAAVNPTDILLRTNAAYAKGTPGIPGMDAAGVVESVGHGVDRLKVGDEVMAVVSPQRPEGGAQIALQVVPAASVVAIPSGATLAQASTLPMNGLTALLALDLLKLKAGETLAVSGGAGLLGYYMIVLAKQRGLRVIADAKASEMDLVRSQGADVVVARGDRFCEGFARRCALRRRGAPMRCSTRPSWGATPSPPSATEALTCRCAAGTRLRPSAESASFRSLSPRRSSGPSGWTSCATWHRGGRSSYASRENTPPNGPRTPSARWRRVGCGGGPSSFSDGLEVAQTLARSSSDATDRTRDRAGIGGSVTATRTHVSRS